jgi:hypothetical protein
VIKPVPAFTPPPPPKITDEQRPLRCGKCELRHYIERERDRYEDLLEQKTCFQERREGLREERAEAEDGKVVLLTDEQMQKDMPEAWEALRQAEAMIEEVERDIEELEDLDEKEMRIEDEIKKRGGWYL